MSTINDVEFNMVSLNVLSTHRSQRTQRPGSDTNYITDMGYDGLTINLEGFELTLGQYDNVVAEFMKSGEQTLVVRDGWKLMVHSTRLAPSMLSGKPNYFPYSLTLVTATPYRESTDSSTRIKTITTNNQTWTQDDTAANITVLGNVNTTPDIKVTSIYTFIASVSQTNKF